MNVSKCVKCSMCVFPKNTLIMKQTRSCEAVHIQHMVQETIVEGKNNQKASHKRLYIRLHTRHMTARHRKPDMCLRNTLSVCVCAGSTWKHIFHKNTLHILHHHCLSHLKLHTHTVSISSSFTAHTHTVAMRDSLVHSLISDIMIRRTETNSFILIAECWRFIHVWLHLTLCIFWVVLDDTNYLKCVCVHSKTVIITSTHTTCSALRTQKVWRTRSLSRRQ